MDEQTKQIATVNWNRAVLRAASIAETAAWSFEPGYLSPASDTIRRRFGRYIAARIRTELSVTDNGEPLEELLGAETPVQRKTD